jgi:hypothetical protein
MMGSGIPKVLKRVEEERGEVEFEKREGGGGEGGDVLMHARKGYKTLTFDICQKWTFNNPQWNPANCSCKMPSHD